MRRLVVVVTVAASLAGVSSAVASNPYSYGPWGSCKYLTYNRADRPIWVWGYKEYYKGRPDGRCVSQ